VVAFLRCLSLRKGHIFLAVFIFFHKVRHVEEGVAFQANVNKSGLHTGQDAGDAALVYGAGERVFVLALVIDFRQPVVFDERQPGLMRGAGDINFFCHAASYISAGRLGLRGNVRTGPIWERRWRE
jgi:hypothetical protein